MRLTRDNCDLIVRYRREYGRPWMARWARLQLPAEEGTLALGDPRVSKEDTGVRTFVHPQHAEFVGAAVEADSRLGESPHMIRCRGGLPRGTLMQEMGHRLGCPWQPLDRPIRRAPSSHD